jgi:hypothetical protein
MGLTGAVLVIILASAGCGTTTSSDLASARVPLPAGSRPSEIAKMVCAHEAQEKFATVLGIRAVVTAPTWIGHLYSCRYMYANGYFTLSVKELSSWGQTLAYFRGLRSELGVDSIFPKLGQGGFSTKDGSVVVRKDWKVLVVDDTGLPAEFGNPPTPAADVAVIVANVILGCWDGD